MEEDEQNGANPIEIAKLINKILNTENPKLRYLAGPKAEKFFVILKRFLPESLVQFIVEKYYKL